MEHNKGKIKFEVKDAALSIAMFFTVFFFSSAEMFFVNKDEFALDADKVLVPMLLLALASSACGFLILTAARKISKKLYTAVECTGLGLLLSFYVQMLFLNGRMLTIGEDQTKTLDDTRLLVTNTAVYFLVFTVPFLIKALAAKKQEKSSIKKISKNMTVFVSVLIFLMQLMGLIASAAEASKQKIPFDYDRYLSYEPAFSLSKEGNIVVFLVDRLDSTWFEVFLSDKPELTQTFDGFTYYANNVSNYTATFPSIINMFTHREYGFDIKYYDFLYEAWGERCIFDDLKDAGYDVDLLACRNSTYHDLKNIENRCDNIYYTDKMLKINYGIIMITMSDISMGKIMPYLFKPLFINKYTTDFSANFYSYTDMPDDYMIKKVCSEGDVRFYKYLDKHGLNADAENKKFVFTHFNGAHDVSRDVSEISPDFADGMEADTETTVMGVFEILNRYFEQMKELGIYDNSTIIIMADHGRQPYELNHGNGMELNAPITATLAIKPAGAQRGRFGIDAQSELSNIDFAASVLEYAGINHDSYGMSYNDIIKNNIHRERTLQTMNVKSDDEILKTAKYSITGNARDFNNWKVINDD